jgi:hypothetical protein
MSEPSNDSLLALADAALRKAAANVVRLAKQTGTPVIMRVDGEIRSVSPYDLPTFEDEPEVDRPIQAPN